MKAPSHILRLYTRTARRYKKLVAKLNRTSTSPYQRKTFIDQIRKLLRKLRELETQLRIAAATGAVVLMLSTTPAQAQEAEEELPFSTLGPFVRQNRLNNPLREPVFHENKPALAVIDHDGDGDFDIVLGEYSYYYGWGGRLRYFENRTSDGQSLFLELLGEDNPFYGIRGATYGSAPAFADIDEDGDLDLFLGQYGSAVDYDFPETQGIEYYRNDGGIYTKQTGPWNDQTGEGNPFDFVSLGYQVRPVLVDFDNDSDIDLLVGSRFDVGTYPYYNRKHLQYYRNDGDGNFTPVDWTLDELPASYNDTVTPALADLDNDGDYDLIIGNYYDEQLSYYIQVSPDNFEKQYDEWDPVTKTGNPFSGFQFAAHPSSVFFDFNNDGLLDLFVADESGYYDKYSDHIIDYYENTGESVFVERMDFDNPFDGVYVSENASPVLVDIDGDGDLDALVGNKYSYSYYDYETNQYVYIESTVAYYKNEEGVFRRVYDEEDPFDGNDLYGNFSPDLADLDGDGDLDLISADFFGDVFYFRNDEGVFNEESEFNPFEGISHPYYSAARFLDIDDDDDYDLVIADNFGDIFLHENTGTPQAPLFSPTPNVASPLDTVSYHTWSTPHIRFTDLDHDGDLDILFNGAWPDVETGAFVVGENVGSPGNPVYRNFFGALFLEPNTSEAAYVNVAMADVDGDGDLDAFFGNPDGTVSYYENQNQKVTAVVSDDPTGYNNGEDPVPVAPEFTITDEDNDLIVQATVAILDYEEPETLSFTPQAGISGVFDTGTGILTFRGRATVAEYETLLRSVTFEVTYGEAGRQRAPKNTIIGKTISFEVFDMDFTNPQAVEKTIEIFVNDPPSVNTQTVNIVAGGSVTVDLKTLITDPNGSGDLDLGSLQVIAEPESGATTAIDANGILTIDYAGLTFQGTETITVEVCDVPGACAQNTLTLVVSNTPPVIEPEPVSTPAGTTKTLNLINITTDADDNLDHEGFTIISQPTSGAVATIEVVSPAVVNLRLNYEGLTFHGTDQLTIRACDHAGACVESVLEVQVDVDDAPGITVYNAVAPNSTGDNKFMRITGLPEGHKVTIFSRWGDKIFDTDNYDATGNVNAFRGLNNNGTALPTGTYFYIIEIPGQEKITGYLTLKQ